MHKHCRPWLLAFSVLIGPDQLFDEDRSLCSLCPLQSLDSDSGSETVQCVPKLVAAQPEWYNDVMNKKISITLSKELLTSIDRMPGSKQSRSAFIEAVLAQYLGKHSREQAGTGDLGLINKAAEELTLEAEDVLRYQATSEGTRRQKLYAHLEKSRSSSEDFKRVYRESAGRLALLGGTMPDLKNIPRRRVGRD
jgi:hypothetical protein